MENGITLPEGLPALHNIRLVTVSLSGRGWWTVQQGLKAVLQDAAKATDPLSISYWLVQTASFLNNYIWEVNEGPCDCNILLSEDQFAVVCYGLELLAAQDDDCALDVLEVKRDLYAARKIASM